MAGYREYRSGGTDFIRYFYNEPVKPESLENKAKNVTVMLFSGKSDKLVVAEVPVEAGAVAMEDEPPY